MFIENQLPNNTIVIAACKDECFTKLSNKGKKWFKKLGSNMIYSLQYRCSFAFIGITGENDPQPIEKIGLH